MNYLERIMAAAAKRPELFPKGTVTAPRVIHAKRCKRHLGKRCRCIPEIVVATTAGTYSIDKTGNLHPMN